MAELLPSQRLAVTRIVARRWANLLIQIAADRADIGRPPGLGADLADRARLKAERAAEAGQLAGALAVLAGPRLPSLEAGRFLSPDPTHGGRLAYVPHAATRETDRMVEAVLALLVPVADRPAQARKVPA